MMEKNSGISHIVYVDESYTNARYRSISMVSIENENKACITDAFRSILDDSGIAEFKWNKLRQARERFAAIKIIDKVVNLVLDELIKVDVLVWDMESSAHSLANLDDFFDLQQMVTLLFGTVVSAWPGRNRWLLLPDENAGLDWQNMKGVLDPSGLSLRVSGSCFEEVPLQTSSSTDFQLLDIRQICSVEEPVCQVADLFAGIGAYSYQVPARYLAWISRDNGLPYTEGYNAGCADNYTNSECERFMILKHLDDSLKRNGLEIKMRAEHGFRTEAEDMPVNFWFHDDQVDVDLNAIEPDIFS